MGKTVQGSKHNKNRGRKSPNNAPAAPAQNPESTSVPPSPPHTPFKPLRVGIAHDWLVGLRGGEIVLDRIIRAVSQFAVVDGLYTMFDDARPLTPAIDGQRKVVSSLGQRGAASKLLRRWMLPKYPGAIAELSQRLAEDHQKNPIDLLISTSSAAIKNLKPPANVPHLCYIHAPARYIWSEHAEHERGSIFRRLGLRMYRPRYKTWDREGSKSVTMFLANSSHTAREVKRCYDRDATVLHPPVRETFFETHGVMVPRTSEWLVVSALEPYKRIDLAIEAANRDSHPLLIVGTGSDERRLRRLAGPSVKFQTRVSDEDLRVMYRTRRMLLFPQIEDFGLAAAEAQACGLPVVARRAGGASDIVQEGTTGSLFDDGTTLSLLGGIDRCPHEVDEACRANAQRFAAKHFENGLIAAIEQLVGRSVRA